MTLHNKVSLNGAQSSLVSLSTCTFPSHLLHLTQAQRYGVGAASFQPFTPRTHAVTGLQPLNPSSPVPFCRQNVNPSPVCTAAMPHSEALGTDKEVLKKLFFLPVFFLAAVCIKALLGKT